MVIQAAKSSLMLGMSEFCIIWNRVRLLGEKFYFKCCWSQRFSLWWQKVLQVYGLWQEFEGRGARSVPVRALPPNVWGSHHWRQNTKQQKTWVWMYRRFSSAQMCSGFVVKTEHASTSHFSASAPWMNSAVLLWEHAFVPDRADLVYAGDPKTSGREAPALFWLQTRNTPGAWRESR